MRPTASTTSTSPRELAEWLDPIENLAGETERTWVMFNNCKYDYAPRNAREMAEILGDVVAPREVGVATGEPTQQDEPTSAPPERGPNDKFATGQLF